MTFKIPKKKKKNGRPKNRSRAGRPTIMTPETIQKLEAAFAGAKTDQQACIIANISMATLHNFQNANPEFIERKKLLRQTVGIYAINNMIDEIKTKKNVAVSQWWLERKHKDEFSVKVETEHSGRIEHSVETMNDSQLEEVIRELKSDIGIE